LIDTRTGRWLSYLDARMAELPVLVVAAARPAEPGREPTAADIGELGGSATIRLQPLGLVAVVELVSMKAGRSGDE
jgi:hypothetical protein